jgi:hypothetical protein
MFLVRDCVISWFCTTDCPGGKSGQYCIQVSDRPDSTVSFSDTSGRFQTEFIAVICTADRPALGRGPSACAQNCCLLHITVGFCWGTINRRVARVRELSWPFLAHIELICDPPTHSLTLFA